MFTYLLRQSGSTMCYKLTMLFLTLLIISCSSKPQRAPEIPPENRGRMLQPSSGFSSSSSEILRGDFAGNKATENFIKMMVSKHGFDPYQLNEVLSEAKELDWVLRLMDRQAPTAKPATGPNGAWIRYRSKFITPANVERGVEFWQQYQQELDKAWRVYGVPPEIIVGIIGVETRWGRVMGKTRILDALSTLAFSYPRRATYFSGELETFLLMTRNEKINPREPQGSYAGAMGYGQFMPSSFRDYAVDFNGDGHINLWDPADAIGSVANYFKSHGWAKNEEVAVVASGRAPGLDHGFSTRYTPSALASAGLRPQEAITQHKSVSLLRLDMGSYYQYWYGLPNFYVITRYNHSVHYAMAVWSLGKEVNKARFNSR